MSELLFVEWAHAYFGFQPKLNAEELIVIRDRYLLEPNAAVAIQKTMRGAWRGAACMRSSCGG